MIRKSLLNVQRFHWLGTIKESSMPGLHARFFGFPVIELDGAPLKIERRKTLALLAYLLVNDAPVIHGRESLAALFWPEMGQAEAGASAGPPPSSWPLRAVGSRSRRGARRTSIGRSRSFGRGASRPWACRRT